MDKVEEDAKESSTSPQTPRPTPPGEHPWSDYYRLVVFTVMEALFAALTWICFKTQLQLPFSIFDSPFASPKVKSAFTTLFAIWHTVAIAFASGICANAFSREWAANNEQPTDAVSTVTATLWQQFLYFRRSRATKTYRAAFVASIILLLMGSTAPSTITISSDPEIEDRIPLSIIPHIDSLTVTTAVDDPEFNNYLDCLERVQAIMKLEKIDHVLVGYVPPDNWFVPLPYGDQPNATRIEYETDLVSFGYSCEWREPRAFRPEDEAFLIDNTTWFPFPSAGLGTTLQNQSTEVVEGSTIAYLASAHSVQNNGTSAFLFLGGDSQFPVKIRDNPNFTYIDLSDLPRHHDQRQYAVLESRTAKRWFSAPLAAVLLCNPRLRLTTGRIALQPTANLTTTDITVTKTGLSDSPANIHFDSATIIFGEALILTVGLPDDNSGLFNPENSTINFNTITAEMFLTPPASGEWQNASTIRPLPLDEINRRMNEYMLSGLKAFTSGFLPTSRLVDVPATALSRNVSVSRSVNGLSFATNEEYTILHLTLTTIAAVLLSILAWLNTSQGRAPFDLTHVKTE